MAREKLELVSSVNSQKASPRPAPFSFGEDFVGRPQRVSTLLGGFEYPGEVIVADEWRSEFGRALSGVSMFRLVLLQSSEGPSPEEIGDKRICVALQEASRPDNDRDRVRGVRERGAEYNVQVDDSRTKQATEADIEALRAVRQKFVATTDSGLTRLASALVDYESEINESLADRSRSLWKSGSVVTAVSFGDSSGLPQQIFLLDSPESWLAVTAARLVDRTFDLETSLWSEKVFSDLQSGRTSNARKQLRQVCGIRLGEETAIERIRGLFGAESDEVSAENLIDLLVHELAYPPVIAMLWILAYALETDSEVELADPDGSRQFVSSDSIFEDSFAEIVLDQVAVLRSEKSGEWDAVLPYLQLITPHANSTKFGGGRLSDGEEFELQLSTVRDRLNQVTPIMLSLEVASGAVDRPLTRDAKKLANVIDATTWQDYVMRARTFFGSVAALRRAISGAAHHWAAVEVAPEIERVIYYLDQVEFGRIDHSLALERQLLRSRIDLKYLIESPQENAWSMLRDDFERWRQEYRRAYIEDHVQKQEHNRSVLARINETNRRVEQIGLLGSIDAVHIADDNSDVEKLWNETIQMFAVCDYEGSEIRLIDEPACPNCHARLGQPTNHTDIIDMISEIESVFDGYRDRLAKVVYGLVLESPSADRLQSLFRLNSAGDLSDIANVLDDKVISFLNELFDKRSGNTGDWASPHS
jgi:hypothetical protein